MSNYQQHTQSLSEIINNNTNNLELCWQNLTYTVKDKTVLKDVSGLATNKSLTAIMGSSGSGKTTMLESLAVRIKDVQGTVTLNNVLMDAASMREISGFLPQFALTVESLTALEYMQFVSTMKLYYTTTKIERALRIEKLLTQFGLKKCCEFQLTKLSGGEKKRLFLVAELLSNPAIVFCDEPTTGLDSYNALHIIKGLRDIALEGKIVIISIHQPSSNIVEYFTKIVLISQGSVVLQGTTDEIDSFLNGINIICPDAFNKAEFYVKQISLIPDMEEECKKRINDIKNKYLDSKLIVNYNKYKNYYSPRKAYNRRLKCPIHIQFVWLLWREYIETKRNFFPSFIAIIIFALTGVLIALFYSATQHSLKNVQDTSGFLYLIMSEIMFTQTYSVLDTFPSKIPIFLKEKDLYNTIVYYTVKVLATVPQTIFYPYCFLLIIYTGIQFPLFIDMASIMAVASSTAISFGFLLSALFETSESINLVLVPINMIFIATSGMFVNIRTLRYDLRWLKSLSTFFYTYEAVSILQWSEVSEIDCLNSTTNCYKDGNEVLQEKGFDAENYVTDICILLLMSIVMHIIGCISMIRRRKNCSTVMVK